MNDIFELHRGTAPLLISLPHNGSAPSLAASCARPPMRPKSRANRAA